VLERYAFDDAAAAVPDQLAAARAAARAAGFKANREASCSVCA